MKLISIAVLALLTSAHKLNQKNNQNLGSHHKDKHACDYVDDKGEEIETSLAVQLDSQMHLKSRDDDDTAEGAKVKWAQMQA